MANFRSQAADPGIKKAAHRGARSGQLQTLIRKHLRERLDVLRRTDDGFEVARKDLKLRGAGELLGTRQAGLIEMKVADLVRDAHLIDAVQRTAVLLRNHPAVVAKWIRRWIGDAGSRYGKV